MEKTDTKRMEDLSLGFDQIEKRIQSIPREVKVFEDRKKQKEQDRLQILGDIKKVREGRQRELVSGHNVDSMTQRIEELNKKVELIEEEVLGLTEKVIELRAEEERLPEEKNLCRDDIVRLKLSPLLQEYNRAGEAVSNALRKIYSLMEENNFPFGANEMNQWGKFLTCSSWIGLRIIPRIFPASEKAGEDFFNLIKIGEKKNEEAIKKFSETINAKKEAKSPA